MKRQLSQQEKNTVLKQQADSNGTLRCYISGELINQLEDDVEYDHILAWDLDGETDVTNIRAVLKKYHSRKKTKSLEETRNNFQLEKLFLDKKDGVKLQDIFKLKSIKKKTIRYYKDEENFVIESSDESRSFQSFKDPILGVDYCYGRIPIDWIENDDQEGLQPRVIDYKRLIQIRDHLKDHAQLAPSIARAIDSSLKLFDGQHKLAGQILNAATEIDVKIYVSPQEEASKKKLFDELMITNLDAHSKLKQVPFYTSTLLDRMSIIYKEILEEFLSSKPVEDHSEEKFVKFLKVEKAFSSADATKMLRSAIGSACHTGSALEKFTAEESKSANHPISMEIFNKLIFPNTVFMEASTAQFTSSRDHRNSETANFHILSQIIKDETKIENWVSNKKSTDLTSEQRKARRYWHKGSVLTWAPFLSDIIINACNMQSRDEREKLLYRPVITDDIKERIKTSLNRLFSHPMWDEPDGELDTFLVSAVKHTEYFERKGISMRYILSGIQ